MEAAEVDAIIVALDKLRPIANLDHNGRRDFLDLENRLIELVPPNTLP
jgi:hypothetical protein